MGRSDDDRARRVVGGLDHPPDWEDQQKREKEQRKRDEQERQRYEEQRKLAEKMRQQRLAERAKRDAFDAANRHEAERAYNQDCQRRREGIRRMREKKKGIERRIPFLRAPSTPTLYGPEPAHQARLLDIERCTLDKGIKEEEAALDDKEPFIRRHLDELWTQRDKHRPRQ